MVNLKSKKNRLSMLPESMTLVKSKLVCISDKTVRCSVTLYGLYCSIAYHLVTYEQKNVMETAYESKKLHK